MVVAWIVVVAEPQCFSAVIVCGSLLQLLGHSHPSDEHRTITAPNAMLYSRRTHVCGHQEDRVSIRYCDTSGARRPPSSRALPSDEVFHEKPRIRLATVAMAHWAPIRLLPRPQPVDWSFRHTSEARCKVCHVYEHDRMDPTDVTPPGEAVQSCMACISWWHEACMSPAV